MYVYFKKRINVLCKSLKSLNPLFFALNVYFKEGKTVLTVSSKPPMLRTWGSSIHM